jgi:hypothetical protein
MLYRSHVTQFDFSHFVIINKYISNNIQVAYACHVPHTQFTPTNGSLIKLTNLPLMLRVNLR